MNPKRTMLLLAIALLANLGLVAVMAAFALLGPGVFGGRFDFRVIAAVPTVSALISFVWILSRSRSVNSMAGHIAVTIAGTLVMMAVFLVLLLPAFYTGAELAGMLDQRFPHAFYRPDDLLAPK